MKYKIDMQKAFRIALTKRGRTATEVADTMGRNRKTLYSAFYGNPTLSTITAVSIELGFKVSQLTSFGEEGEIINKGECKPLTPEADLVAAYGYCPICGNLGITRERRIDGYDTCSKGHKYKSKEANQSINKGEKS